MTGVQTCALPIYEEDRVTVPEVYSVAVLLKAGDSVEAGAPWSGSYPTPADAEKWAGGNHDGMEYFALPEVDPNTGGLLAMNYELPDFHILIPGSYDPATASADPKAPALRPEARRCGKGWVRTGRSRGGP